MSSGAPSWSRLTRESPSVSEPRCQCHGRAGGRRPLGGGSAEGEGDVRAPTGCSSGSTSPPCRLATIDAPAMSTLRTIARCAIRSIGADPHREPPEPERRLLEVRDADRDVAEPNDAADLVVLPRRRRQAVVDAASQWPWTSLQPTPGT